LNACRPQASRWLAGLLGLVLLSATVVLPLLATAPAFGQSEERTPSVRVYASRIGLVGGRTANGHTILERDRFVALPSAAVLSSRAGHEFQVRVTYRDRSAVAPVWDIGPWNQNDDYWAVSRRGAPDLPRFLPQAEAAMSWGHNGGRTLLTGRQVTSPAAIDLADGLFWDDLGMVQSDWVQVEFLWLNE
jgi:hypothetical protein